MDDPSNFALLLLFPSLHYIRFYSFVTRAFKKNKNSAPQVVIINSIILVRMFVVMFLLLIIIIFLQ